MYHTGVDAVGLVAVDLGYHGVAIVSRLPFEKQFSKAFCGKEDCRHVSVTLAGKRPLTLHNLYVPAGGDEPDP